MITALPIARVVVAALEPDPAERRVPSRDPDTEPELVAELAPSPIAQEREPVAHRRQPCGRPATRGRLKDRVVEEDDACRRLRSARACRRARR